jgi:hypothetical protein
MKLAIFRMVLVVNQLGSTHPLVEGAASLTALLGSD